MYFIFHSHPSNKLVLNRSSSNVRCCNVSYRSVLVLCFFCLSKFMLGTIKNLINWLLTVPKCIAPVIVETTEYFVSNKRLLNNYTIHVLHVCVCVCVQASDSEKEIGLLQTISKML